MFLSKKPIKHISLLAREVWEDCTANQDVNDVSAIRGNGTEGTKELKG